MQHEIRHILIEIECAWVAYTDAQPPEICRAKVQFDIPNTVMAAMAAPLF